MKFNVRKNHFTHPILGTMDAYSIEGGFPFLTTGQLAIGTFPFTSALTIWTDPDRPSDIAISGAVNLIHSGDDFRTEVERRFFDDYVKFTRDEYLEYARDPAYGITPAMLPEIHTPSEIWSIFRPLERAVSISEPSESYPSDVAEVSLSFSVAFDTEHDFYIVFKDGKFFELTK
jgi:hypothetical protein